MDPTQSRPHRPTSRGVVPARTPLQAALVVSEDEALAALAGLVLEEHSLDAVAGRVADLAVALLPDIAQASVVLVRDATVRTAVFAGPAAAALDERQYDAGFGPGTRAALSGVTEHLRHDALVASSSSFSVLATRCGVSSVLCLALSTRDRPLGSLNLYCSGDGEHRDLSEQVMVAARLFASRAAVVLANAVAHADARQECDHLRRSLASRGVIEQAKGVIVSRTGLSAEEAFASLAASSQDSNRKLHLIAADVMRAAQRAGAGSRR